MGCSSAPLCEVDPEHQGCQSQTDGDGDATGDGDGDATGDGDNCGNGALDNNEECDDGNRIDGDGCDNDCTDTQILQVVAGGFHTCVLIEGGRVRCWGGSSAGVVGLGNTNDIGDDETPAESMDIPFPGAAVGLDAGGAHVCALFDDGALRCWGVGFTGQLGNGDFITLGDDETLEGLPASDVGGTPSQFSLGANHSCARFPDDFIRCWGSNVNGQLGNGNTMNIGDDEVPASIGPVIISSTIAVAAGAGHTCAMSIDFKLTCWGRNDHGQLGYGNTLSFGDDPGEVPQFVGPIELEPPSLPNGATLTEVSLGAAHSCALFTSGDALCWGGNDHGQLGQGNVEDWGNGNSETPAMLEPINLGGAATAISAGSSHTCALLEDGDVRCWGYNERGQLGLGHPGVDAVGDDELPNAVPTVTLGAPAVAISSGYYHNCALLDTNEITCWGDNSDGRLGYGHTDTIGDNETPESAGSVEIF